MVFTNFSSSTGAPFSQRRGNLRVTFIYKYMQSIYIVRDSGCYCYYVWITITI